MQKNVQEIVYVRQELNDRWSDGKDNFAVSMAKKPRKDATKEQILTVPCRQKKACKIVPMSGTF